MDTTKDTSLTYEQKPSDFLPALAPISPVISFSSFEGNADQSPPSIAKAKYKRFVTSGRIATALALINENIGEGDEVLVPAYHCESMVAPVRHTGAQAIFYRIHADTMVDVESIEALLNPNTKAIVVTHFFGFPQNVTALRKFCDNHKLVMIEDCAHSFFGKSGGKHLGYYSDYAIASTMKFFPVFDGGLLASNHHQLQNIKLNRPSLYIEIKAFFSVIERGVAFNRLSLAGKVFGFLARIKDAIWSGIKTLFFKEKRSFSIGPGAAEGGFSFDPAWLDVKATKVSRYIINKIDQTSLVEKRRRNYARYAEALIDIKGCQLLHTALPEDSAPVVVPVYFENCEKVSEALRAKRVPIWHFGEFLDPLVTPETCSVSYEYSRKVIQLPCHQELKEEEINWIIDEIKASSVETT